MSDDDIRLLALDGGGVRGLSSLMILRNLMTTIDPDDPPKPCDYFDMIGGTSTGDLIAVLLGRVRMSVDDCITAYASTSDEVFEKKSHRVMMNGQLRGRFDSGALDRAIKQILVRTGHAENTLIRDAANACRVFVCATSRETIDPVCLTSYRSLRSTHLLDCTTVWEACRATSAATTFFDPVAIGPFGEQFVDGALGTNNPVAALWSQAQDVLQALICSGCIRQLTPGTDMEGHRNVEKPLPHYRGGIEVALYISFPEEEGFVSCESADLSWRGDIESTCQNRVTLFVLTPQS
ncbi:Chitin synthase regulatory factor 4 [Verticillium dahliae VDG2]|nr:Chitin synthase regulatory factor 4 [Verticillium dahliae VDG2]